MTAREIAKVLNINVELQAIAERIRLDTDRLLELGVETGWFWGQLSNALDHAMRFAEA